MAISITAVDGTTITSRDVDGNGNNFIYLIGALSFSGTYTAQANGGDSMGITGIADLVASSTPVTAWVYSPAGVTNRYFPIMSDGSLKITDAAGTELANGAGYPTDSPHFVAVFRKLL